MKNNRSAKPLPWLAGVAFFIMVGVNGMANALPINGRTTGDISNAYKNLFAPAGITFSIWALFISFYSFIQYISLNIIEKIAIRTATEIAK